MCGILGLIGRDGSGVTSRTFSHALDLIRHRGPDDEGYLLYDASSGRVIEAGGEDSAGTLSLPDVVGIPESDFDVRFGHRRLSILDVTPAGHQPMPYMNARYWIAFNGEIYNYLELRSELTKLGHTFRTGTDTEVLVAAYAQWGVGMLEKLIGMFAVAILDKQESSVFLARDPFGIKPLYSCRIGNSLSFSSEIKPLLFLKRGNRRVDTDALYNYARFGIVDGHGSTMFAGIDEFPSATYAIIGLDGKVQQSDSYWNPKFAAETERNISFQDAASELLRLFDRSVDLHLRSDVPLGSCLSGGLDSTAIVATMRQCLGPSAPIHAFGFKSGDPQRSDASYIDLAADRFALTLHSTSATGEELTNDLAELVRIQEQPFGSTSIYAQYRVFALAKQAGVTVLLDGQGADEIFGGYSTAVSAQIASLLLRGQLKAVVALARTPHVSAPGARRRMILSAGGRILPNRFVAPLMHAVGEPLFPTWLDASWFQHRGHQAVPRVQGRGRNALKEELLLFTSRLSLPQLLRYEDRNSMAFSLESRVPFCTREIADFAFSLPSSFLITSAGETKAVLRRAVAHRIPPAIMVRSKVGFETPARAWMASVQDWMRGLMQRDTLRRLPFIKHDDTARTFAAEMNGTGPLSSSLWRLLNLGVWAEEFGVEF